MSENTENIDKPQEQTVLQKSQIRQDIEEVIAFARKSSQDPDLPIATILQAIANSFSAPNAEQEDASPLHTRQVYKGECDPSMNFEHQMAQLMRAIRGNQTHTIVAELESLAGKEVKTETPYKADDHPALVFRKKHFMHLGPISVRFKAQMLLSNSSTRRPTSGRRIGPPREYNI